MIMVKNIKQCVEDELFSRGYRKIVYDSIRVKYHLLYRKSFSPGLRIDIWYCKSSELYEMDRVCLNRTDNTLEINSSRMYQVCGEKLLRKLDEYEMSILMLKNGH